MENFDINTVSAMSDRYKNAGLGDTWGGKFLASVTKEAKEPRGNGVSILNQLLSGTSPETLKEQSEWIDSVNKLTGNTNEFLTRLSACVKRGYALEAWNIKKVEEIEARFTPAGRIATPDEMDLMNQIKRYISCQSSCYWSKRASMHKRITNIIYLAISGCSITDADIDFVKCQFNGLLTDLKSLKHPSGSLRWINSRFDTQRTSVLVISSSYVAENGLLSVNIIVNGSPATISPKRLYKHPMKIPVYK